MLAVRLVGSHPLWGHMLWNAARLFADKLDTDKGICCGKNVLELGAGAALPSFIAALNGAKKVLSRNSDCKVMITDYPDHELLQNIEHNACSILPELVANSTVKFKVLANK